MKKQLLTLSLSLAALFQVGLIPAAYSQYAITWNGSSNGNWNDNANWTPNPFWGSTTTAVFDASSTNTNATFIGTARTIGGITFAAGSSNVNIRLSAGASGTTNRDLIMQRSSGAIILVEAGANSNYVIGKDGRGSLHLNNALTIEHNGSGQLRIDSTIRGNHSVTKTGAGHLTLSGINTYTGNTTVNAGTLTLAGGSQTSFFLGQNGESNSINGTGTVNINGSFLLDLTSASTLANASWELVSGVNSVFGDNFAISSTLGEFTNLGNGLWSKDENGVTYQFSQLTGNLTVVPETSTAGAIIGLSALTYAFVLARRKSKKAVA